MVCYGNEISESVIGWNILDLIKQGTDEGQIVPTKKGIGKEIH